MNYKIHVSAEHIKSKKSQKFILYSKDREVTALLSDLFKNFLPSRILIVKDWKNV